MKRRDGPWGTRCGYCSEANHRGPDGSPGTYTQIWPKPHCGCIYIHLCPERCRLGSGSTWLQYICEERETERPACQFCTSLISVRFGNLETPIPCLFILLPSLALVLKTNCPECPGYKLLKRASVFLAFDGVEKLRKASGERIAPPQGSWAYIFVTFMCMKAFFFISTQGLPM